MQEIRTFFKNIGKTFLTVGLFLSAFALTSEAANKSSANHNSSAKVKEGYFRDLETEKLYVVYSKDNRSCVLVQDKGGYEVVDFASSDLNRDAKLAVRLHREGSQKLTTYNDPDVIECLSKREAFIAIQKGDSPEVEKRNL